MTHYLEMGRLTEEGVNLVKHFLIDYEYSQRREPSKLLLLTTKFEMTIYKDPGNNIRDMENIQLISMCFVEKYLYDLNGIQPGIRLGDMIHNR